MRKSERKEKVRKRKVQGKTEVKKCQICKRIKENAERGENI
jgi:hypothetical protein